MIKIKNLLIVPVILTATLLTACGTEKLKEEAQIAVDAFNSAVTAYNEKAIPYNEVVVKVEEANSELQGILDSAQEVIDKGEEPYNEQTFEDLKTAIIDAESAKVDIPEKLDEAEAMSVAEDAGRSELKDLIEKATDASEKISSYSVPDVPEIPDYTEEIEKVSSAQKAYEDSIQSLKQITAPTDEFVMERLKRIDTITDMAAVTEDHDPNGMLGKQGGYIGCIYFSDSQVNRSELYIEPGDDVIDVATDGGGAVEIYSSVEEATGRNDYLGTLHYSIAPPGSHYVEGTCVIRTSDYLKASQQEELTSKITEALTAID